MTNKSILIDAAHKEETRVVVTDNGILQDFDRESISVKKVKGNIYLAKVTRVEPSLQAAFIDYGEDKHGFLPFNDIHPSYFDLNDEERKSVEDLLGKSQVKNDEDNSEEEDQVSDGVVENISQQSGDEGSSNGTHSVEDEVETSRDGFSQAIYKKFKIQDVIKSGQLILIQVTKEERGNKGASMTTFISLAGKYCVLMPNTANKGGVSRKVENFRDRKILRSILSELEIPTDRSVIIRTAGVGKKPDEIKCDYEYLSRLWQSIMESAKEVKNPLFIHGEDDVIKRCIRDVYNEDVAEVIVEGKEAYDNVKKYIDLTMPSGDHNIVHFQDRTPIFSKLGIENQISALYQKEISLKSGASIVIDQAEALVAIDINSGRATKESDIEETAYQTNLEACKEIAKQLRLRDLAGLVVIDFIDMDDQKHRRQVERTLRDELRDDRARIQLGRISEFGLLELSRQRLGSSLFETITQPCQHCHGTGYVKSVEVCTMSIFRAIRNAAIEKQTKVIYVYTSSQVISHIANFKRKELLVTEANYKVNIFLHQDEDVGSAGFKIKKRKSLSSQERREINFEKETGKVNQLDIQKDHFDNFVASDIEDSESSDNDNHSNNKDRNNRNSRSRSKGGRAPNNRNRRGGSNKNNQRNRSRSNPQKSQKTGIIKSVFGIFK